MNNKSSLLAARTIAESFRNKVTSRFTIDGRLVGLNEIVGVARYSRFEGAKQKKGETSRCEWAILAGKVPVFLGPISISFLWVEPNLRRDPDNVSAGAKFVLDALVETGRIPNDSRKWVKEIRHSFPEPDARKPRIEITIEGL